MQGWTLELEWGYRQPNPVRPSYSLDKIVAEQDGPATEKGEDTRKLPTVDIISLGYEL